MTGFTVPDDVFTTAGARYRLGSELVSDGMAVVHSADDLVN